MSSERAYFLPSNNTATVFLVIASILLIYVINCLLYILYYIFDHLITLSLLYLCPTMKPLTGCQVSQVVRRPPRDQIYKVAVVFRHSGVRIPYLAPFSKF